MKKFLFVLIPLLLIFLLMDGAVRLLRLKPLQNETYYFGFNGCPDYFLKDGTVYRSNPDKDIEPAVFSAEKAPETVRIFVLGGSAVYGEPYGPNGSFSYWLREGLRRSAPDRRVEVINCGRRGFGSVRVTNIFKEIVHYDPDLVVVYFGNNEIRDDHFHRREINIEMRPHLRRLKRFLDHSMIFRMVYHLAVKKKITSHGMEDAAGVMGSDTFSTDLFQPYIERVENIRKVLDTRYGGRYHPAAKWSDGGEFPDSLRDRMAMLEPVWIPKFESIFRSNVETMMDLAEQEAASLLFLTRGVNCYYNRDFRKVFQQTDRANRVLRELSEERGLRIIETMERLRTAFGEEIGYNAFMDHVHLTLDANQVIAHAIHKAVYSMKLVPGPGTPGSIPEDPGTFEDETVTRILLNERCYTLLGWQEWVMMPEKASAAAEEAVVTLAEKALALNADFYEAYILLGGFYTAMDRPQQAESVWRKMREHFVNQ